VSRADGFEIERTWLLTAVPAPSELAALGATPVEIEQVYLAPGPDGGHRRIRRLRGPDGETFVRTEKSGHGVTRRERESPIDRASYQALLAEADPTRRPIRKTRHRIPHGRHTIELDVFSDPPGLVLLEVEIATPDDPIDPWPVAIAPLVAREVTNDRSYENAELALRHLVRTTRDHLIAGEGADYTAAIYGSLLVTAIVAATWRSNAPAGPIGLSIVGSVLVFWLAHVWSAIVNQRVHGEVNVPEARAIALDEAPILTAAVVPAVCLGFGGIGLLSADAAFQLALAACVVQLFLWGLVVGRAAHARWSVALRVAIVDCLLGLIIVALKVLVIH